MVSPDARATLGIAALALFGALGGCAAASPSTTQDRPSFVEHPADGTGVVTRVVDGDTVRLEVDGSELRVRLIGIDAPEVHPELECFGAEATAALERLIPVGSTVSFRYDHERRDQYDRELLYLTTDDTTFVNLALVEGGFAVAVLFEPNDAHWPELRAAESAARDARLGLWGVC